MGTQSKLNIHKEFIIIDKAVVRSCSVEKVFLEISQNLQEHTCVRLSFLSPDRLSGGNKVSFTFEQGEFQTEHQAKLIFLKKIRARRFCAALITTGATASC